MKAYLNAFMSMVLSSLLMVGCLTQTVNVKKEQKQAVDVKKEQKELRPESDYKFQMRKTTVADVIERLGTPHKRETDKDGYETLTYKASRPSGKLLKYTVHTYTFTKKGLLTGHGKHGSNE